MKTVVMIAVMLTARMAFAQVPMNVESLPSPGLAPGKSHTQKLFGDSLVSSFLIHITKEVPLHKYLDHSEHVYIIQGKAEMQLGEKTFTVKKGDVIFIPKNTPHSVKVISEIPLKALSLQAPLFDGTDRVMLNDK